MDWVRTGDTCRRIVDVCYKMVPIAGMRPRKVPSTQRRILIHSAVFSNKPYVVFIIGMFFGIMSVYAILSCIQLYTQEQNDVPMDLSNYMLPIINASSAFSRLIQNFLANKYGS